MNNQHNQDQGEITRFNSLAREWWDIDGPMWALHAINPLRINLINDFVELAGKAVLDIGCGGGIASEALAQRGARVTGIDLAPDALSVATEHAASASLAISYSCTSAEELAEQQPRSFDLVCCLELLEHVPAPVQLVAAAARLAKSGGTVIFSTINRTPKAFIQAIVGAEYLLGIVPKGTHRYDMLVRPSELISWARASGLKPVATRGMVYNPLTKNFRLDRDLAVNYFLIAHTP